MVKLLSAKYCFYSLCAWIVALGCVTRSVEAQNVDRPFRIWNVLQDGAGSFARKTVVGVDHEDFVAFATGDPRPLEFPIRLEFPSVVQPSGGIASLYCDVGPAFVSQGLLQQFPNLVSWAGLCTGNAQVTLTYNTNMQGSLQVSFFINGHTVRVHPEDYDNTIYGVEMARDMPVDPNLRFIRKEPPEDEGEDEDASRRRAASLFSAAYYNKSNRDLQNADTAYKFRVAILVTEGYSNRVDPNAATTGDKSNIVQYLNDILARINGIFLREVGVFFELIPQQSNLICISPAGGDDPPGCTGWPDGSDLGAVLNNADANIQAQGVASSAYDIGHVLQAEGFGFATLGTLCVTNKARGTSGFGNLGLDVSSDNFVVDLIAHEFGHQLSASHTHRRCPPRSGDPNTDQSLSLANAVETGSGVTIMSYVGICGQDQNGVDTDLQRDADPYFHSTSLATMRSYVEARVMTPNCGNDATTIPVTPPVVEALMPDPNDTCIVPVGSYVQLSGRITSTADASTYYFAWDRIDPGREEYSDRTVPRWVPQTPYPDEPIRYLPNLYLTTFETVLNDADQYEEIVPQSPIDMDFRFIARTQYSELDLIQQNEYAAALAGSFGFTDITLSYVNTDTPLQFTAVPASVTSFSSETVTWTGGTVLSPNVEILIARNTMQGVGANLNYEYNTDVDFLDWISIGTFPNTGSASINIPDFDNNPDVPVSLMIRSVDATNTGLDTPDCYFFDMESSIAYANGVGEVTVSLAPSAVPTSSPTTSVAPSMEPTQVPSLSSVPSSSPTGAPSSSIAPSDSPTGVPTSTPTESPTESVQPSSSPTDSPTLSLVPSVTPTGVPTISPSSPPSASSHPSSLPTDIPTLSSIPSSTPTDTPTTSAEPSDSPTVSVAPSVNSAAPSESPTISSQPSPQPSISPTSAPSDSPSQSPTESFNPTNLPTDEPSVQPSLSPTREPTTLPSASPTLSSQPSDIPTSQPSISLQPSPTPTDIPTTSPSSQPSETPTVSSAPSSASDAPSEAPTVSAQPSSSAGPTESPSASPSISNPPSVSPTLNPTESVQPSTSPSSLPTAVPTEVPSIPPTSLPTISPSEEPTSSIAPSQAPTSSAAPTILPSSGPTVGDLCLEPEVLCPSGFGQSKSANGRGLRRKNGKNSSKGKSNKSNNDPDGDENIRLFPICVVASRQGGKGMSMMGRRARRKNGTNKSSKGSKGGDGSSMDNESSDVVFETICISDDDYAALQGGETSNPVVSRGGKGKSSSLASLQDFTCGCCEAAQEDDVPEFCLGPPICADNSFPCSPDDRRLRRKSMGSKSKSKGKGSQDERSTSICVNGVTLCVDIYDPEYLGGMGFSCGPCS